MELSGVRLTYNYVEQFFRDNGYKQLQEHIKNHPNYENLKDVKWHIDHIFPITAFAKYNIRDISLINYLENLRPLRYKETNMTR